MWAGKGKRWCGGCGQRLPLNQYTIKMVGRVQSRCDTCYKKKENSTDR
jgi:hypothetical protein